MLLAIDVGNTADRHRSLRQGRRHSTGTGAERDLMDHWRIATSAERTSDELALLVQEFLGFHGFSFDDDVDGVALCSSVPSITGRRAGDDRPLLRVPGDRRRARREDGHADPLRQPEGGRPRPHRRRAGGLRPLRRPDDRRRLRHRHHLRGHLGQGRVPRRRHLPGHRHQPRRAVRPGRRAAASSWSSPAT